MREGAARFPNARMIFHSDEHPAEATLAEMHAQSLRLASALRALGLGPGDVVAIQVPNWLEGALVFQAAMLLGVVTLPIVHIYGPAEVGFVLRQSGARAFICPARWRHIDYLAGSATRPARCWLGT
jgi:acyl-coenzyme A synthetase/AMP-(fatty) acid ligase